MAGAAQGVAHGSAASAVADVVEIAHCYKYIKVGEHDDPDRWNTICLTEKPHVMVGVSNDPEKKVIYVSWDVTPEHGRWSLNNAQNELTLRFNARFGQEGFEDPPLWPVCLQRHSDAQPGREWQGYDRRGSRIILEHIKSVKRGAVGGWESTDVL
jgi:hypothetical protein